MKLYFKQPITDSARLKFLEWNLKERQYYYAIYYKMYNIALEKGFIDDTMFSNKDILKLKALDIWQEPEPDYNEWIGEDCVFSDYLIETDNDCLYLSILDSITDYNSFRMINGNTYPYCMLKSDYVKLLKEQSK